MRTDRSLWCWGHGQQGQLGIGDRGDWGVPHRVGTDFDWAKILADNDHTCGVRTDRSLWCWGNSKYGQLGLGDTHGRIVPTQVGADLDWAEISADSVSSYHTCGVRTDGSLWCWGWNEYGQLGLGDRHKRFVPTRV